MIHISNHKLFGEIPLSKYKNTSPSDVDKCSYCYHKIEIGHNFYHHYYLNRSYCCMYCARKDQTDYFLNNGKRVAK